LQELDRRVTLKSRILVAIEINTAWTSELRRRATGLRESLSSVYALKPNSVETSQFASRATPVLLNLIYAPE
jgi:hypothetical protein